MRFLLSLFVASAWAQWPDLSSPLAGIGGGQDDAAVVVGVENYAFVSDVPGARRNADAWHAYFTDTLKIPSDRVTLLRDHEATDAKLRRFARQAASEVRPGGTVWFVFIGHGAPSKDGADGLLVGADAQQDPDGLYARSVSRNELLGLLSKGKQARTVVVLDSCFSGRAPTGETLVAGLQPLVVMASPPAADARTVILTAAKSDQFAGPLPKSPDMRPAFSYLVLGALRGWASDEGGKVTASAAVEFARKGLALDKGRVQTPELSGAGETVLSTGREKAPDLGKLDRQPRGGLDFQVSGLPAVPTIVAPRALDSSSSGLDLDNVDVDALEKYNAVFKFDKSEAAGGEKAEAWKRLAEEVPAYAEAAGKRAAEWESFVAQEKAAAEARRQRLEARDRDWGKLFRLLGLEVVPASDKARWAARFIAAYKDAPGLTPDSAQALLAHLPSGPDKVAVKKVAERGNLAEPPAGTSSPAFPLGRAKRAMEWVSIPGGSFVMGTDNPRPGSMGEFQKPAHTVQVAAFQLTRSEVTVAQYKTCVDAGACAPPSGQGKACNYGKAGRESHPVNCLSWDQAQQFAVWVGARLPTEAEWEFAARNRGRTTHPWGNGAPTCEHAVICEKETQPVCSKKAGDTELGLCDMVGNAYEWVQDWLHENYVGAPSDGSAWESPPAQYRVVRGTGFGGAAGDVDTFYRGGNTQGSPGYEQQGFRLARGGR